MNNVSGRLASVLATCSLFLAACSLSVPERAMVPLAIDGEQVKLAMITYKPPGNGPFPTLIFHHGSTGFGYHPERFSVPYGPDLLARWFTTRGIAVVLPSRRGRGGSEGVYDEGFAKDRTKGYTCEEAQALDGADRALRDIDAVTAAILARSFVDRTRVIVGGHSRGGILAVAWSGAHPNVPRAVVNFVGGWCSGAAAINQTLFKRGAAYPQPSLWLYGDKDPFYSLSHSRANFAAFQAAGGKATFHEYTPLGLSGHQIENMPLLWTADMEAYLAERGLLAKAADLRDSKL